LTGNFVRIECTKYAIKVSEMRHHKLGLSYTPTGYGTKVPTVYMVRTIDQTWRRVYCAIFSNSGALYVMHGKEKTLVDLLGVY
jgi:hypothetical protein